jgi:hypothetical protein
MSSAEGGAEETQLHSVSACAAPGILSSLLFLARSFPDTTLTGPCSTVPCNN